MHLHASGSCCSFKAMVFNPLFCVFTPLIYRWILQTSLLEEESPVPVSFKRKSDFWSTLNSSFPAFSPKHWTTMTVWSSRVSGVYILILSEDKLIIKNWLVQICSGLTDVTLLIRDLLIWQKYTLFFMALTAWSAPCLLPIYLHPGPAWGERMVVAIALFFFLLPACHMFLFWLAAMGSATSVERALLIAVLGLILSNPHWLQYWVVTTNKVDLGQTSGLSPGGWFLLSLIPFLILSLMFCLDCDFLILFSGTTWK